MKAPGALLCLAIASTAQAVEADRFMPFGDPPVPSCGDELCAYIDRIRNRR